MVKKGRFRRIISLALFATSVLTITVTAAYYNTYSTVATIPNGNGCNRAQGFAVGSSYVYTAKCNDDESKQVIYRTKISDGSTTLMTNGKTSATYITSLGHANDMDTCTIGNKYHLFVATMKTGSESLVKLQYSGNTYTQLGGYTLKHNGQNVAISGAKKYAKDSSYIYFLFFVTDGTENCVGVYRGKVPLNSNSGVVNISHAFDLNIGNALVNGSTVPGLADYICIKANSVTEREVIDKLAEASLAGVEIQLIIRGICCILPGVPGETENVHVISVVGRFLEHARIYLFGRGDSAEVYISSADLMTRNLNRRVEIACPVYDPRLREQLK